MLQIKPLTNNFSVSPQISLDDLSVIAVLGYKSVINNRPDGETSDQVENNIIKEKCVELGLEYLYLPVVASQITSKDCQGLSHYLSKMPKPIFAFCRTGTRSCLLWLGSAEDKQILECRVQEAKIQGYQFDMDHLVSLMNG
ncbi:TIGR01244 family sulfur transferase [uncultured Psychromonas sp.]|uniref:TIGR01244 family sulfur transferase n=1 Tax=uncultured Psychromonas sp. TaxID=173974 RepID=UPI002605EC07|nr:TIGR01244 family sulfur transferase [uncultured Psychromonas sp.]